MSKHTFRSGSDEIHDTYVRIVENADVSKSSLFQGVEEKVVETPSDFELLLKWIETDQSLPEFMGREDLAKALRPDRDKDANAGLGMVLEGIWNRDVRIIDEGIERLGQEYPQFVERAEAYSSMISESEGDPVEQKDMITAIGEIVLGLKDRDRGQAYMGAAKMGRIDPEYPEGVLELLDDKFDQEYWRDDQELTSGDRELLYESFRGVVEALEADEPDYETAIRYGEAVMEFDSQLGSMMADYLVRKAPEDQLEEMDEYLEE